MKITEHKNPLRGANKFNDIRKKFDVVLIIGNGFDLNLGLKTSYLDFLKSDNFNDLIKNHNQFAKYLKSQKDLNGWIDVENELVNYSNSHSSKTDEFVEEFQELSNALKKYLEVAEQSEIEEGSEAFALLSQIVSYKTLILNFNYTDSIKYSLTKILGDFYSDPIYHIQIHGSIESDIIFGIDDKAEISKNHIFLKKSVNKNYQSINIDEYLCECNSIGIFGHSLGETDHMYFKNFFYNTCSEDSPSSNKEISIYFPDEYSRLELHRQLDILTQNNISKFKRNNAVEFIQVNKKK